MILKVERNDELRYQSIQTGGIKQAAQLNQNVRGTNQLTKQNSSNQDQLYQNLNILESSKIGERCQLSHKLNNFDQQNELRNYSIPINDISPMKKLFIPSQNAEENNFNTLQKQRKSPSQLIRILQSQKKNIRQVYASQINKNKQQDEKVKSKMREVQQKIIRENLENTKKLTFLNQENNYSNSFNMINQNNQNQNQKNINSLCSFLAQFRVLRNMANKNMLFSDYQNHISSQNHLIQTSNYNQNWNIFQSKVEQSTEQKNNQTQNMIQSSQQTIRKSVSTIPQQTTLNGIIKQSFTQIRQGQNQYGKYNQIQIKRAQSRVSSYSTSLQNSHKSSFKRISTVVSDENLEQEIKEANEKKQYICDLTNKLTEQYTKEQNDCQSQSGNNFLFHSVSLDSLLSPTTSYSMNNVLIDNSQPNFEQITNPILRKKFQNQKQLIMKNLLHKTKQLQLKQQQIQEQQPQKLGIFTDQPKRSKKIRHSKQMSLDDSSTFSEFIGFNNQKDQYPHHALLNQSQQNNFKNNDFSKQKNLILQNNPKVNQRLSPNKPQKGFECQMVCIDSQNSSNKLEKQYLLKSNRDKQSAKDMTIFGLNQQSSIKQRPQTTQIQSKSQDLYSRQIVNYDQKKVDFQERAKNRPTTACNIPKQISQISNQLIQNYQKQKNLTKNKQNPFNSDSIKYYFEDLKSWENSRVEESHDFKFS